MAWTHVATYSSTGSKSAGTADTASVTASVGDILVVCCAADNRSAEDAIGTSAVTDASSNTYTRKAYYNDQAGGNSSRAAAAIFTTSVTTALSSQNVTFTPDADVPAKAFVVYRFTGGSTTARSGTQETFHSGSTSAALTHTGPQSGDLVVGCTAWEQSEGTTITFDSDTSSGSWSTGVTNGTTGGGSDGNMTVGAQYKITTGTASQAWTTTVGSNTSWAACLISLQASGGGGGTSANAGAVSTSATSNAVTSTGYSSIFVADYGTTQAQVQSAANAASGKHLVFPANTTYTDITGITIPANCYVEGNNSTLKFGNNTTASGSQSDELMKVNGSGCTIDGLNFDGNSANQGGIWSQHRHCVRIHGAFSNATVKNCDFTNIIGDGVYVNIGTSTNCTVGPNNTFTANYDNRNGVSVITGTDVEVYSNTFTNCTKSGMPGPIDIEPNSSSENLQDILVHDNTISAGSTAGTGTLPGIVYGGFQNASADNIQIYSNTITGTRLDHGILIIGISGGPFNNATNIDVYSNSISGIGSTANFGVGLSHYIGADVYNNTFNGMQYGIYNYKACLGTSTGNTFTGVTTNITNDDPHCS